MANNNDERDDSSAGLEVGFERIEKDRLMGVFTFTGQTIDFEDHGDFVIVKSFDLELLESLGMDLAMDLLRSIDDDTR